MPPPSIDLKGEAWLGHGLCGSILGSKRTAEALNSHVSSRDSALTSARRLPLRSALPWPQSSLGATGAAEDHSTDDVLAELTQSSDELSEARVAGASRAKRVRN